MPITTVLLDAGGVILDETAHEKEHARIITAIIAETHAGYAVDDYWRDAERAVQSFCPEVYQFVLWKNLQQDRELFEKAKERHLAQWKTNRPPLLMMAGLAGEIVKIAERFAIGLAGQYGRDILDLLEQEGVLERLKYRVTQDDFAITKPDPRYYEQICERIGVAPSSCIMVGDRIDKDITPAKQLGMKTIRIRGGLHSNQQPRIPFEIPDVTLDAVTGLATAVERLAG
jgi:FMN phosphatase YigB (HAD superfamily)